MKNTIYIQNLKCGGCANTIIKNISQIESISNAEVNVEESAVTFDAISENEVELVKNILKKIGYPEDGEANSLGSKAKSYISCAVGKMNN
uniref:heavy-metal-associated domain-containing protein n=1 Tax=Flavobacterium sp. TaxID=239 RepID=UPI0040499DB1